MASQDRPAASGYWIRKSWHCSSCHFAKNKFTSQECKGCGIDPPNTILALQQLDHGDRAPPHNKHRHYQRGSKLDPENTVLRQRCENGDLDFPDMAYPDDPNLIESLFGKRQAENWKKDIVKWKTQGFFDFIPADRLEGQMDDEEEEELKEAIVKAQSETKKSWSCDACTYVNEPLVTSCEVCGMVKTESIRKPNQLLPNPKPQVVIDESELLLDPTIREIRRTCRALHVPIEKALYFEDLFDKCLVYATLVPQAQKCSSAAIQKLKSLRFEAALDLLQEGIFFIEKFNIREERKLHGSELGSAPLIDDLKYELVRQDSERKVKVLDMYEYVLRLITQENQISAEGLSLVVELKNRYAISEADHVKVLEKIGLNESGYKEFVERGSSSIARRECIVCMDGHASHVVMECMHLVVCDGCVKTVEKDGNCPQCRKKSNSIRRVY